MDFNTKFFGIILFNTLHWKQHMVPQETTYALFIFHSVMSYGIIFGATDHRVSIFLDYKKENKNN
jgi:hypothetical protein